MLRLSLPPADGAARCILRDTRSSAVFTHQLRTLLTLSGGLDRLRQNATLWRRFNDANLWLPAWRYTADLASRDEAEEFLAAIDAVRQWIGHNI